MRSTDMRPLGVQLYFLPVQTRVPLKFGHDSLTYVTCARVRLTVQGAQGEQATGWGETPLSVQWVWPSSLSYHERHNAMKSFCLLLAKRWSECSLHGHPMEIGHTFIQEDLKQLLATFNADRGEPMPWLAALVCCSAFDIAIHDAYGHLHGCSVYATYNERFMNADLSHYLSSAAGSNLSFAGQYPDSFLVQPPPARLVAWHLVGGEDRILESELTGEEPDDGYPVLLRDWIVLDQLSCLKIKLRGNDLAWDYDRIVTVGRIGLELGVLWLTTDFNCTVTDPEYVTTILDRLLVEEPRIYGMVLYVEQPFPYDLEKHQIDVHAVSARKPLFMDESAHDWHLIQLGRSLGWTGVALKTCKTQTEALLSLCWAKAHGMTLMVQDLTNPMLAQIPHVLLAAHAGTIMGVETNSMQFYPEASAAERNVHPGLYRRRHGQVSLDTLRGSGFGYRLEEIVRELPEPVFSSLS